MVHTRRVIRLQDGLSRVARFLDWLWPTLPADDYDWGIYETVLDSHRRSRADFRNANSRVLSRFDASDYGAVDVAESPIFYTCDFCCRRNCHTDRRHLEHVSVRCADGGALRYQYGSGVASESDARAQ